MAKVKIQGHASGTGVLTVTAPNTSTDRTITLPDATGTLLASEGAVTINDTGADVDFRVEGSGEANALFVQGSDGNVGIGTAAPAKPLHVMETSAGAETVPLVLTNHSSDAGTAVSLGFGAIGSTDHYSKIQSQRNGSGDWDFSLWNANASGVLTERLTIDKNGRGVSEFTAKAWCNFNGTGTVAIRDSHNVSSITDSGTGDYDVNFTNNMANTNYTAFGTCDGGNYESVTANISDTSFFNLWVWNTGVGAQDQTLVCGLVFGD